MLRELRIRDDQMKAFAEVYEDGFRLRARAWLRETFPDICASYSDSDCAAIVETALEQTAQYRIGREVDILRWINLMFAFGFDFHQNPDLPWVHEVLDDPGVHPDAIVPWLTSRARNHLNTEPRG
jgi:hypothetical protein